MYEGAIVPITLLWMQPSTRHPISEGGKYISPKFGLYNLHQKFRDAAKNQPPPRLLEKKLSEFKNAKVTIVPTPPDEG